MIVSKLKYQTAIICFAFLYWILYTNTVLATVLTTVQPGQLFPNSAVSGGNITSDGGSAITARGVCWSKSTKPTIANRKTVDGSGSGAFSSTLTGLTPNTHYYVRAYATNSSGTEYGNEYSFSTSYISTIVTTTFPTMVASTNVISGGNVASGSGITSRGVCWNTISEPSVLESKTIDDAGSGIFVSNVTGLTPGTTYFIRAYATNSSGTAYGTEFSFTTATANSPFYSLSKETIQSGTTANLFNVSSFNKILYIAGDGLILKSTDLGKTWVKIYTNQNILFYGVEFSDSKSGYAVGLDKSDLALNAFIKVYKTIDGGVTWMLMPEPRDPLMGFISGIQKNYSGLNFRLGGISLISNNRFVCGAGSSTYYSSTAGRGLQWDVQPTETTCVYYLDENRAFKGGRKLSFGQAGGTTFGSLHDGVIFDIDFIKGNIGFAIEECDASGYSRVYKIDANQPYGGTPILLSWEKTPKIYTKPYSLLGLDMINDKEGMVVGENGLAYFTLDGGNVYEKADMGTTEQLNKIHFVTNGIAVIAGNKGKIIRLDLKRNGEVEDGRHFFSENIQWVNTSPYQNSQKDFFKVHIQNSKTYVLGDDVVLTSTDEGKTWKELISGTNKQFRHIEFSDNNIGWIGAISGTPQTAETYSLYKTTDGGISWKLIKELSGVFRLNEQFLRSHIVIRDALNIKIVSQNENFYSPDGGSTWQTLNNYGVYFSDIIRVEENRWFGGTFTQAEAYSFDFNMQSFGLVKGFIGAAPGDAVEKFGSNALFMNNSNQVFLAYDKEYDFLGDNVYHTYGGFFSDTYPFTYFRLTNRFSYIPLNAYGVHSPFYNVVYIVGEKGFIAKSTTGGDWPSSGNYPMPHKTWYGEESGVYTTLRDIAMFDQEHGIAVGDHGVILVRQQTTTANQAKRNSNEKIHLFPNPAVNVLNVQIETTEYKTMDIEIISVEGKVLSKKTIDSPNQVLHIDLSCLPGGIYLCRVNTGNNIETVKFIKTTN